MGASRTRRVLAAQIFAFAAAAAAVVLALAFWRGEAASPRLLGLGCLAFGAGLLAGTFGFGAIRLVLGCRGEAVRFVAAALLAGSGYAGCLALAFAALSRLVINPVDRSLIEEYGLYHVVLGTLIDTLGAFAVTGAKYLLPWTVPALSLVAGLLAVPPARVEKRPDA